MRRFFCPPQNIQKDKIKITDPKEIHHILDVLRLKPEDEILIFDGEEKEYFGLIESISGQEISLKIKKVIQDKNKKISISLACAIPKKSKIDDIVEEVTELGVTRIMPMITARTIVKFDETKKAARLKRWQVIALNAAKQSRRLSLPSIEPIRKFSDILAEIKNYDLCLIPNLEGKRKHIRDILSTHKPKRILIFIGPEGDFTREEVKAAQDKGAKAISLGDTVLRVKTAAVSAVSFVKFYYEGN